MEALDAAVAGQHQIAYRQGGLQAGADAVQNGPAAFVQQGQQGGQHLPADAVDDRAEFTVVPEAGTVRGNHHVIDAGRAHHVFKIRTPQLRRHLGAHEPAQLAGEVANAAAGSGHQHLAAQKPFATFQRIKRGQTRDRQGRRVVIRNSIWNDGKIYCRQGHKLRPTLHAAGESHNPLGHGRATAVARGGFDHPGQVPADLGARRRPFGAAQFAPIKRERSNGDNRLVRIGHRVRDLAKLKTARHVGFGHHCFHTKSP